jgi:hypothetical protein
MLRVEGIFLDQLDTVAFNLFHNADMLVVGVDDFHMFADIHSASPFCSQHAAPLTPDITRCSWHSTILASDRGLEIALTARLQGRISAGYSVIVVIDQDHATRTIRSRAQMSAESLWSGDHDALVERAEPPTATPFQIDCLVRHDPFALSLRRKPAVSGLVAMP